MMESRRPFRFRLGWLLSVMAICAAIVLGGALSGVNTINENETARNLSLELSCNNYNTLRRQIENAPSIRREVYGALGFDDRQIQLINEEQQRTRKIQLDILGPRPEGCDPPVVVEPVVIAR